MSQAEIIKYDIQKVIDENQGQLAVFRLNETGDDIITDLGYTSKLIKMTPEIGELLIKNRNEYNRTHKNPINRDINRPRVHSYATQMKTNQWGLDRSNNFVFARDEEGRLHILQGNHRTEGVVESGIPQWFSAILMPFDEALEMFGYMDKTYNRTVYQDLKVTGKVSKNCSSSVTSLALRLATYDIFNNIKILHSKKIFNTETEYIFIIEKYHSWNLVEKMYNLAQFDKRKNKTLPQPAYLGIIYTYLYEFDEEKFNVFRHFLTGYTNIKTGSSDDPRPKQIIAIQRALDNIYFNKMEEDDEQKERKNQYDQIKTYTNYERMILGMYAIITGWNAYYNNKHLDKNKIKLPNIIAVQEINRLAGYNYLRFYDLKNEYNSLLPEDIEEYNTTYSKNIEDNE